MVEARSLCLFQFELQWMLIHCDPKRAQRESCSELPATEVRGDGDNDLFDSLSICMTAPSSFGSR